MNGSEAEHLEGSFTPSLDTAKVMIKDYLEQNHGEIIDYVDQVNVLDLSLTLIFSACEELEKEGKITGVD